MDKELFLREAHKILKTHSKQPLPDMLYHYTTADALISIIRDKQLWLSRSDFLNDPSEIEYGIQLIKDALHEIETKNGEFLERILEHSQLLSRQRMFILSLTVQNESLMLWSHYSKSDGYAIGFDTKTLLSQFSVFQNLSLLLPVTHFGPVVYDRKKQREEVMSTIKPILRWYSKLDSESQAEIFQMHTAEIGMALLRKALMWKESHFNQEEEYRFVVINFVERARHSGQSPIKFRNLGGVITPYIEVPLAAKYTPLNCITEIRIGPKNNMGNAVIGLRDFLDEHDLDSTTVEKSAFRLR